MAYRDSDYVFGPGEDTQSWTILSYFIVDENTGAVCFVPSVSHSYTADAFYAFLTSRPSPGRKPSRNWLRDNGWSWSSTPDGAKTTFGDGNRVCTVYKASVYGYYDFSYESLQILPATNDRRYMGVKRISENRYTLDSHLMPETIKHRALAACIDGLKGQEHDSQTA